MLPLPLGLRLHDRRGDELVVVRRRRAYLFPSLDHMCIDVYGFDKSQIAQSNIPARMREADREVRAFPESGNALMTVKTSQDFVHLELGLTTTGP